MTVATFFGLFSIWQKLNLLREIIIVLNDQKLKKLSSHPMSQWLHFEINIANLHSLNEFKLPLLT